MLGSAGTLWVSTSPPRSGPRLRNRVPPTVYSPSGNAAWGPAIETVARGLPRLEEEVRDGEVTQWPLGVDHHDQLPVGLPDAQLGPGLATEEAMYPVSASVALCSM